MSLRAAKARASLRAAMALASLRAAKALASASSEGSDEFASNEGSGESASREDSTESESGQDSGESASSEGSGVSVSSEGSGESASSEVLVILCNCAVSPELSLLDNAIEYQRLILQMYAYLPVISHNIAFHSNGLEFVIHFRAHGVKVKTNNKSK